MAEKEKKKKEKKEKKEKEAEAKEKEAKEIGNVFSFYSKIGVAAIKLKSTLKAGEKIRIKGATTDFEQTADSMQIDCKNVEKAGKGADVGIKVIDRVRPGDKVYIVKE